MTFAHPGYSSSPADPSVLIDLLTDGLPMLGRVHVVAHVKALAHRLNLQQMTTLINLSTLLMDRPDDQGIYEQRQLDTINEWAAESLNDPERRLRRLAHANNKPCGEGCYGNDCTLP